MSQYIIINSGTKRVVSKPMAMYNAHIMVKKLNDIYGKKVYEAIRDEEEAKKENK